LLQHLFHSWLSLFSSFKFRASALWDIFREVATVICPRRREQPVYLVDLFTDGFALRYTR
jgi:hypothetical protein